MSQNFKKLLLASTVIVGASVALNTISQAEPKHSFDAQQKEAIESIIQNYLLENPKIVMDAAEAFRVQQVAAEEQRAQAAIKNNMDTLMNGDAPSIGPKDADVTVVEFFDYNCGYCKRALPDINAALENDKSVRFVFKEMPILGPTSLTAAQWAMAADMQGKYFEFHSELMQYRGPKEEEQLAKIAKSLGLDVDKMKKDAKSEAVQKKIGADVALAREIGISGTPAFIVGNTLHGGYLGEEGLQQAIKEERTRAKQDG